MLSLLDLSLIINCLFALVLISFLINILTQQFSAMKKLLGIEITQFFVVLSGSIFIGFMIYAFIVQYVTLGL